MITESSDPREVSDFHFIQLKTLKLTKGNERVPASKTLNIVAAASKYDLLFVGIENGFKVLRLQDVLDLDEGKENKGIEENYSATFIQSETPVALSLNASQSILAVCAEYSLTVVVNFYDVSAFAESGSAWKYFCQVPLSPNGMELRDFAWNPVAEGLFAFCLNDGSLHIRELSGTSVNPSASAQNANALSVCWSPKGKQLVVGKSTGHFTQYKPNLQEVKTIAPPALEEHPIVVSSICWISNFSFAVLYVVGDSPNLFIVSTPKDSPVSYVNFYDVCLGNNISSTQKYLMHLESTWGILTCASSDSIEIAVLGDMPNWVQWDLREDGKALLPGKNGATHAVGMAVLYSAQKRIIISESEAYPPMPVIFFLTNNGLLLPFHMVNSKPDAVSLVAPPIVVEPKKKLENERTSLKRSSTSDNQPTQTTIATVANNFSTPSQLVAEGSLSHPAGMNITFGMTTNSSFTNTENKDQSGNKTTVMTSNTPEVISTKAAVRENNEQGFTSVNKENDMLANRNNTYMAAIISEIQNFSKELQDMKELHNHIPPIDNEVEMATLKTFSMNLHNFQKDIAETMQSLNNEIFVLKNILLENFVMVEEAHSRERRRNDHSYITMLKERTLDPVTAKRLQKINQHYQYLSIQLQEVSDKLDQDSIHLLSNKRDALKGMTNFSSTEAIYKTIVNNQKIIHNLKKEADTLLKKTEEKKMRNISKSRQWGSFHKRSTHEDLSKLADEFLHVKVSIEEDKEPPVAKKLSPQSQKFLISLLKDANVVTVRPTAVYSPSQSRLLSNAATFEESSLVESKEQEQNIDVAKQMTNEVSKKGDSQRGDTQVSTAVSKISSLSLDNSKIELIPQQYNPVYESITPPEVNSSTENKTFTYSPEQESRLKFIYNLIPAQTNISNASAQEITLSIPTPKDNQHFTSETSSNEESSAITRSSSQMTFTSAAISKPTEHFSPLDASKSIENEVSKPAVTPAFTQPSTSSSGFQFGNSLGQNEEAGVPSFSLNSKWVNVQPVATSTISPVTTSEAKNQTALGSLLLGQQDKNTKSSTFFSPAASQSSSFTLPIIKSVVTSSAPQITPVTKSSHEISNISETKSPSFSFKLPADTTVIEKPVSQTAEEVPSTSSISFFPSNLSVPNMSLSEANKNVVTLKSSEPLSEPSCTSVEAGPNIILIKSDTGNISSDQLTITPIENSEDDASANSQSDALDGFSSLSILKDAISASIPEVSTQDTSAALPVQSTVIVTSPAASSASLTSSFSVPVVSDEVSITTQPPTLVPETSSIPASSTTFSVASNSSSIFGEKTPSTLPVITSVTSGTNAIKTDATPSFGIKPAPAFGQVTTEPNSFFGSTATTTEAPAFGQPAVSQGGTFGQPVTSPSFPSASGGFFSQSPSFGANVTTNSSEPSTQASAFSFGKSTFGQSNSGSFGLAKSLFGQTPAPTTQANSASSFSFSQSPTNVFGQGHFFSGLGGKPSEENANKNVFGMANTLKQGAETSPFGNANAFGAKSGAFGGAGSFSSGGGSVAQSGFGAFQQTTPQKPAFGSSPAFGGAPTFGSTPAFGAPPTFGSGNALTSQAFGQQMPNFSNIANSSSPTFGSLASQSSGGFGSPPPVSAPTFGSPSGFGNTSFGGGFGNPSTPPSNSSAFTQWRN